MNKSPLVSLDPALPGYQCVVTPTGGDDAQSRGPSLGHEHGIYDGMEVKPILYSSVGLVMLQVLQFGWSTVQLNHSKFHNEDDCDALPVAPDTCIMFPGHSAMEWTLVMCLWIVGGMLGSISCARIADRFGRQLSLQANAVIMITGAAIQAAAPSPPVFVVGRFVAGIASGVNTALCNGYINEISPPHLRNRLGVAFQVAGCTGGLLVTLTVLFANTTSGWRYIAGFPSVLGIIFLLGAPRFLVESPTWLLTKGRHEEAEMVIVRLFGQRNVPLALSWMAVVPESEVELELELSIAAKQDGFRVNKNPWRLLISPMYRQQTLIAVMLAVTQQFSGINAVFFYSSSTFNDAGLSDDRIGNVVINIVNVLPTLFAAGLGTRFGNRRMMLFGHAAMLLCAVGITGALLMDSPVMSVVFTGLYVIAFEVSLGPLVFVLIAAMFPSSLRASGTSVCLFANWCGSLTVGVAYPYVANALGDLGFLPFMVALVSFGLFMAKYLPETAGKTDMEIQAMFHYRS